MKEKITVSSGNVFADLGFSPEEAVVLGMRSQLMCELEQLIAQRGWTQAQAAKELRIAQSRVSDLVRGKWDKFSLDMLIELAARAGRKVTLETA
jgi:predicted XRE-type DNA-binding protein